MPLQFEARKVALKQDRTGYVLTLGLHPDEIPEELLRDFVGARYGCALVRIQDDESPTAYSNRVKTAGMICRDPLFQQFMSERYHIDLDDESETAAVLCDKCRIDSRSQLNGDSVAQSIFDEIVTAFGLWQYEKNNSF